MGFLQDFFGPTQNTSTYQGQQQQSGVNTSGVTSSSTPTLTPQLQQLMTQLLAYSQQDPQAALQPIRQAGLQQINQAYSDVPGQVTQQLARRGYGSSGSMGDSLYRTGLARAGSISGLEGQLATQGIQQGQFGAGLGAQLLNSMKGTSSTSTGYGTSSMSGTNSGSQTQPGPSIFSSMLGGVASLGGLLLGLPTAGGGSLGGNYLSGILGGGGGGGYSDTSKPTWNLPTAGSSGDWAGEYNPFSVKV